MAPEYKKFKLGLVQLSLSNDPGENMQKALEWTAKAADNGADVIVLPELFKSRYFCQTEDTAAIDLAEEVPGPTTGEFARLAKEKKAVILLSLFERRGAGMYHNTLAVLDADGEYLGKYRKMHIPDDYAYYEKFYFTPGDLGFKVFKTKYGNIGTLICWDQWFPEAARLTALKGADVIVYPTAIGWHPVEKEKFGAAQQDSWINVQRGHAIANGIYIGAVNRWGFEKPVEEQDGIEFWGNSFITDPQGNILVRADAAKDEIIIAEVDTEKIETQRRHWPFFRDRRVDFYDGITKKYLDD